MSWTLELGKLGYVNRGAFIDGAYEFNDVVTHNSKVWVATDATVAGEIPEVSGKWQLWFDGTVMTSDPNSVLETDNQGNVVAVAKELGVLQFDDINGLHFAPLPTPNNNTSDAIGVKYLNSNERHFGHGNCFIGTDDCIYTAGYYSTTVPQWSRLKGHGLTYTKIPVDGDDIKFVAVYGFNYGIYAIDSSKNLWYAGYNVSGIAGADPTQSYLFKMTKITTISNVVKVLPLSDDSVGFSVFAITEVGNTRKLFGTGKNYVGVLGLGTTVQVNGFTEVDTSSWVGGVKDIYSEVSSLYSFAVATDFSDDDNMLASGYGGYSNLGLGSTTNQAIFTRIVGGGKAKKVKPMCTYVNRCRLAVLLEDGRVGTCGENAHYQGGTNDTTRYSTLQFTTFSGYVDLECNDGYAGHTWAITSDNKLHECGYTGYYINSDDTNVSMRVLTELESPIKGTVKKVFTNLTYNRHVALFLTTGNELWAIGDDTQNIKGQWSVQNRGMFRVDTDVVDGRVIGTTSSNGFFYTKADGSTRYTGYGAYGVGGSGATPNCVMPFTVKV